MLPIVTLIMSTTNTFILNVVSGKQSEACLDILVVFAAEKYS